MRQVIWPLALLAFTGSPWSAKAADILLTCTIHSTFESTTKTVTQKLEINDARVLIDGEELTKDVTISAAAIIFKTRAELKGELVFESTTRIDRTSGEYVDRRSSPKWAAPVQWTGTCSKAEAPSVKF